MTGLGAGAWRRGFAPVVEVATDATAYEQLVAWEGRDPNWHPA